MTYWAKWDQEKCGPDQSAFNSEAQQSPQRTEQDGHINIVSTDVADSRRLSHYVQHGEAYPYIHRMATPEYMDTFEEPYAVFVFKYASDGESYGIGPFASSTIEIR